MHRLRWMLAALITAAAAGAVVSMAGPGRAHRWESRLLFRVLGQWAILQRRLARVDEPLFAHLALSQVGYGPRMQKQFTSPVAFDSFIIQDERNGAVSFSGGGPIRAVQTDLL